MKNTFLSVVIICALAVAGVGGTLATWADSETSMDNTIITGSVDLKVNGHDDAPWGAGVPRKVYIDCMVPCRVYGPFPVDLWNAGICDTASRAYIHFKDMCCSNAPPKLDATDNTTTGYPCPDTGDLKPEPELVAEFGGKVNCKTVEGIGRTGDECSMKSHIRVWVTDDPDLVPDPDAQIPDERFLVDSKMIDAECVKSYLFDLMPCEPKTIYLYFHLQQPSEEDHDHDYFADPGDIGYDELEWKMFNDWPSWALMRDLITFSMEFDLWLEDNGNNG